jgi:hypothetical protein
MEEPATTAAGSVDADYSGYERNIVDDGAQPWVECAPTECCQLCPCGYVWAEALILDRNNRSANQALVLDLNTDEVLLSAGDLDFDWSGGLRVGYGSRLCHCWSWEAGYLGYFQNSADAGVALDDSLTLPGDLGLQVNNFFGVDDVGVRYASEVHSAEANVVCCCASMGCSSRSVEWLAGFRYLNLNELAAISAFDSAEGTTAYQVRTRNNLYGGQLGARTRHCRGCWNLEATGKAGIFGNDMEQLQSPIIDFPNFQFRESRSSSDGDVAFVGDLNFTAIYQLTRVWGVRTGYNLIWIEGVALAPDQLDFTNTTGSGTGLFADSGVFLHGVNVGLEARW